MLELLGLNQRPTVLVRAACDAIVGLEASEPDVSAVSRAVAVIRRVLCGTPPEQPPDKPAAAELASEILKAHEPPLLAELIVRLPELEFECRKDVAQIVSSL